jgi:hypothetical protein
MNTVSCNAQCVILTSSGVCLVEAICTSALESSPPSLECKSFCRLLACLLQISHGPEGVMTSNTTNTKLEDEENTKVHRHHSMFVLESRPIYILEDSCLDIAVACWKEGGEEEGGEEEGDEGKKIDPSTTAVVRSFLRQVFQTFLAAHSKELIQQEVSAANARLEDACLNYSVQNIVEDNDIESGSDGNTSNIATSSNDKSTVLAFQKFKTTWLQPALAGIVEWNEIKKSDKFQPSPPSDPKPSGNSRPLMQKSAAISITTQNKEIEKVEKRNVQVEKRNVQVAGGSGASAALLLSAGR